MEKLELYKLEAYRGTSSVDPKEIADYILSLEINPVADDGKHSMAEDTYLTNDAPACVDTLFKEALSAFEQESSLKLEFHGAVWFQVHGPQVGSYPHSHGGTVAFVYWAQVPPKSGPFAYHPIGMPGPEFFIEPKAGDYLFFPTSLLHGVKRNFDTEPRVSMSCNFDVMQ